MLEAFSSVLNNYKNKIKNPFFGTFVGVWLIRNWILVYSIFSFDKEYKMQNKIDYINKYFEKKLFWNEFIINVCISFSVLGITYLLLAGSRVLTDFYYKILEPKIIVYFDKNAILTQTEKIKLEKKITLLTSKNNIIVEELSQSENSFRIQTNKIEKLTKKIETDENLYLDKLKLSNEKIKLLEERNLFFLELEDYFEEIIVSLNREQKLAIIGFTKKLKEQSTPFLVKQEIFINNGFVVQSQIKSNATNSSFSFYGNLFIKYCKVKIDNNTFI
ncbi:hypothetical protein [uncultured Flavobacterium sp.]|uniref:hypothetical protein n=1 Tax=uncultured Flavobacterium sp. TaxID=165435 RepID=UPI00292D7ABE|nr:hypothetical protein [uncultured Flavobacterium sp.]